MPTSAFIHLTANFNARSRLKAAGVHLLLSGLVAAACALLVFALWFPWPYREISGGRELFLLVVSVDVVIGPLITFAVFNTAKPRAELRRDLAVVAALQLAALGYGMWTVHLARPVHLVFEYDRFRVVHLVDIAPELHDKVPPGIQLAPLAGPTPLALRQFKDSDEKYRFTMEALGGMQLAARPELWRPYQLERKEVLLAAKPLSSLYTRFKESRADIEAAVARSGRPVQQLLFLPMIARKETGWTVLLDSTTAEIVGFLPLDSF